MIFNPYSVFDVPVNADFETLRATYRRLAREHHPDIAPDKVLATERMAQINRAWAILSDGTRRAAFDSQLKMHLAEQAHPQARRRESARPETSQRAATPRQNGQQNARGQSPRSAASSKSSKAQRTSTSKPAKHGAGGGLRAKLFKRGPSRSKSRSSAPLDAALSHSPIAPRALRLMRRVTLASRLWHRDRNAKVAIEMCRAVLLSDGRNVPARELLSEIFATQGRLELAVMMLDQAIQITPDDQFLRRKRDFLERERFSNGVLRPIAKPSFWQRLRGRFSRKNR